MGAMSAPPVQGGRQPPAPPGMGHKNDLILWLTLHPLQQRVYEVSQTEVQCISACHVVPGACHVVPGSMLSLVPPPASSRPCQLLRIEWACVLSNTKALVHTGGMRCSHVVHFLQAFLTSGPVRAALNKTGSALAALTVLKKICDHPALLSEKAAHLVASAGQQAPTASVQQQPLQHVDMRRPCLCLPASRLSLPPRLVRLSQGA